MIYNYLKKIAVTFLLLLSSVIAFSAININLKTQPTNPTNYGEGFSFDEIKISEGLKDDLSGSSVFNIILTAPSGFYFASMDDPSKNVGDIYTLPSKPDLSGTKTSIDINFTTEGTDSKDEITLSNIKLLPIPSATEYSGNLVINLKKQGASSNIASESFGPYTMITPQIHIPNLNGGCAGEDYHMELSLIYVDSDEDTLILEGSEDIKLDVTLNSTDDGADDIEVIKNDPFDENPKNIVVDQISEYYEQIIIEVEFASGWKISRIINYRYESEDESAELLFYEKPVIEFVDNESEVFVSIIQGDVSLSNYIKNIANYSITTEEGKQQYLIYTDSDVYFRAGIAPLGTHKIFITGNNFGCEHTEILEITVLPDMITAKDIYCQGVDEKDTIKISISALENVLIYDNDIDKIFFDQLNIIGNGGILDAFTLNDALSSTAEFYEFEVNISDLYERATIGNNVSDVTIQFQVIANVRFNSGTTTISRDMIVGRKISQIKTPRKDGFIEDFSEVLCWDSEPIELTSNRIIDTIKSSTNSNYILKDDKDRFWLDLPVFDSTVNTTIQLTLSYYDINSCPGDSNYLVTIQSVPVAKFTHDTVCLGTSLKFNQFSPDSSWVNIVGWQWDFGDDYDISNFADTSQKVIPSSLTTTEGTYKEPAHRYRDAGKKAITLSVMSVYGCVNKVTDTIVVGQYPTPLFTFDGKLMDHPVSLVNQSGVFPDDSVSFFEYTITTPSNTIKTFTSTDNSNQTFIPEEPGVYTVSLRATTKNNCRQFVDTLIPVFPVEQVTDDRFYFEDFTNGTNETGWIPSHSYLENKQKSWKHVPVEGVFNDNSKHASGSMWLTGIPEDKVNNEQNWMESPCFDISELNFPMISIDVFNSVEPGRDGAAIQYTLNDGKTWKTLGQKGYGQNWYNMDGIYSNPGVNDDGTNVGSHGWSKDTTGWIVARYPLDNVKAESIDSGGCVRFRIAYNSNDYHDTAYVGFGFDNFLVGKRKRIVLLEQLINTTWEKEYNFSEEDRYDAEAMNNFVDKRAGEVVDIRYHVSSQGNKDPLFDAFGNWQDNSVRASELGATAFGPLWAMDGTSIRSRIKGKNQGITYKKALEKRGLIDPAFEIYIEKPEPNGSAIKFKATIKKVSGHIDEKIGAHQHWVRFAIVQKEYTDETGKEHRNVFIDLLPNGIGSIVKQINPPFEVGSEITVETNWEPKIKTSGNDYRLVIFISGDMMNGEIEQVEFKDLDNADIPQYTTSLGDIPMIENDLVLYPNPVKDKLFINKTEKTGMVTSWNIIDISGHVIQTGYFENQGMFMEIDVSGIPKGFYVLQVIRQNGNILSGKFAKEDY